MNRLNNNLLVLVTLLGMQPFTFILCVQFHSVIHSVLPKYWKMTSYRSALCAIKIIKITFGFRVKRKIGMRLTNKTLYVPEERQHTFKSTCPPLSLENKMCSDEKNGIWNYLIFPRRREKYPAKPPLCNSPKL